MLCVCVVRVVVVWLVYDNEFCKGSKFSGLEKTGFLFGSLLLSCQPFIIKEAEENAEVEEKACTV